MEVKGNLTKEDRLATLKRFIMPHQKKVAKVLVGDPSQDYLKSRYELMLQEKQEKSDLEFQNRKAELARKKIIELRQRQVEKARKKAEKIKKRMEEAQKRKLEAEKKAERIKK